MATISQVERVECAQRSNEYVQEPLWQQRE